MTENKMFCFQCQETAKGTGCTIKGVCGKEAETSKWQDLLLSVVRGVGTIQHTLGGNASKYIKQGGHGHCSEKTIARSSFKQEHYFP